MMSCHNGVRSGEEGFGANSNGAACAAWLKLFVLVSSSDGSQGDILDPSICELMERRNRRRVQKRMTFVTRLPLFADPFPGMLVGRIGKRFDRSSHPKKLHSRLLWGLLLAVHCPLLTTSCREFLPYGSKVMLSSYL